MRTSKYLKKIDGVVFTAALGLLCSEDKMDEINKDHNHTTAVPPDDPYGCHDFDCV